MKNTKSKILFKDFNEVEREVIILKAILDLLNLLINHQMVDIRGKAPDVQVYFKTEIHQKIFNILLADLFSLVDKRVFGWEKTYLKFLEEICKNPQVSGKKSILKLQNATKDLTNWLEEEISYPSFWSSNLGKEFEISLKRREFLKICGIISKHNFTNLNTIVNDLTEILNKKGISVTPEESLLILDDFYQHFHENVLNYHTTKIVELLNNLRWGLFYYFVQESGRISRHQREHGNFETFNPHKNLKKPFARNIYFELVTSASEKPYVKKFETPEYLRKRH